MTTDTPAGKIPTGVFVACPPQTAALPSRLPAKYRAYKRSGCGAHRSAGRHAEPKLPPAAEETPDAFYGHAFRISAYGRKCDFGENPTSEATAAKAENRRRKLRTAPRNGAPGPQSASGRKARSGDGQRPPDASVGNGIPFRPKILSIFAYRIRSCAGKPFSSTWTER